MQPVQRLLCPQSPLRRLSLGISKTPSLPRLLQGMPVWLLGMHVTPQARSPLSRAGAAGLGALPPVGLRPWAGLFWKTYLLSQRPPQLQVQVLLMALPWPGQSSHLSLPCILTACWPILRLPLHLHPPTAPGLQPSPHAFTDPVISKQVPFLVLMSLGPLRTPTLLPRHSAMASKPLESRQAPVQLYRVLDRRWAPPPPRLTAGWRAQPPLPSRTIWDCQGPRLSNLPQRCQGTCLPRRLALEGPESCLRILETLRKPAPPQPLPGVTGPLSRALQPAASALN
mmetsp:Transcript_38108/g.107664  ORF Transcript_38108/g.107664 Transcript_38108/m.107664 type:complete len:283 (-) Transcript_38108:1747-2595(-)